MTILLLRQYDNPIETTKMIVDKLHGPIHGFPTQWIQVRQLDVIHFLGLDNATGMTNCFEVAEREQHLRAALGMSLGKGYGFVVVSPAQYQYNAASQVLKTLVGPRY